MLALPLHTEDKRWGQEEEAWQKERCHKEGAAIGQARSQFLQSQFWGPKKKIMGKDWLAHRHTPKLVTRQIGQAREEGLRQSRLLSAPLPQSPADQESSVSSSRPQTVAGHDRAEEAAVPEREGEGQAFPDPTGAANRSQEV